MRDENVTEQTAEMSPLMCFCDAQRIFARDAQRFKKLGFAGGSREASSEALWIC